VVGSSTPLRYVKKCRNLGQTLEFLKDFCYKPNQPSPNNSQRIAFLESEFLSNKFLNTPTTTTTTTTTSTTTTTTPQTKKSTNKLLLLLLPDRMFAACHKIPREEAEKTVAPPPPAVQVRQIIATTIASRSSK